MNLKSVDHEVTEINAIKVDLKKGKTESVKQLIAKDVPISIYINGKHLVTILSTVGKTKELAVGFLIGEGILNLKEEIVDLQVKEQVVRVKTNVDVEKRIQLYQTTKIVTTACGSVENLPKLIARLLDRVEKPRVKSQIKVSPQLITQAISELNRKAITPGMHGSAIFYRDGKLISFAEDVGRHNAVDKVIGEALLLDVELSQCILTSTGRQTADIVLKCARVGIPIIASIMGPLYSGVYIAEKTGVTLVCFVRGQQMNIYTHPERII
jgi:FdhD protein